MLDWISGRAVHGVPPRIHRALFLLLLTCLCLALSLCPLAAQTNFDLSGAWQYQIVTNLSYPPPTNWVSTTVPGYTSSTNYARAWFCKTFTLPPLPAGYLVKLQFGGVKYRAIVYLNGQSLGGCFNGYDAFELDATAAALPGQPNELLVAVTDWTGLFSAPVDFSNLKPGENARDRANNVILAPIGGHYSLFGIWEPLFIKYVPEVSISEVFVMPSVRQNQLKVHAKVRNESTAPVTATLRHRVLNQAAEVLALPDQTFNLGVGQVLEVETNAAWTSPRLWTSEDPFLYSVESTLLPPGFPTDTARTRFGFREFWTSGDSFFLNGTKLHLLATACWPPTAPVTDAAIRQALQDVKSGNNKAIRLHTQPWPEAWYRIADEVGILIVEEAAVWCDPRAYRLSDPVFWANYADHLRAAVRRDENHPSIILWSLENEILHCGGDQIFSGAITNLAELGLLVKSLDPTRPITFEADLDPGGVADAIGLHYPHEFPDFSFWPNTAYWMDQPLSKSYAPGGQWLWDHSKPLYIGEHLWISDTAPEGFSSLYGDLPYFDPSHYRLLAKAWTWQMQIEAYRSYRVSAHCPWTMVEDPASSGIQNLNTNRNQLYQAEAAAYHPTAVVVGEYDHDFFPGETVMRTLTVYNDTPTNGDFVLQWRVNGNASSHGFSLAAGSQTNLGVAFTAPSSAGLFNLELELRRAGNLVFTSAIPATAQMATAFALSPGRRLALYDPAGTTAPIFSSLPWLSITNLATAGYGQFDLLVLGRNALQPESLPTVGGNTIAAQWRSFMEAGGWVLVLEQTNLPTWMPLGLALANDPAAFSFPVAAHPLVADLTPEQMRWWRGDNAVARSTIQVPTRGNFKPLVHVGSRQGLDRAALIEVPIGRGGMVCSQLLLVEKVATEPMAGLLLQRLLNYAGVQAAPHYAGLLGEPASPASQALQKVGLVAENLFGHLATTDLSRFPVVIVAGTNSAWTEASQNLSALQTYVEMGGHLVLHRPTEAFLAAAAPILLPGTTWTTNVSLPVVRSDASHPPRRFTNHDLYWEDDAGSWNRPAVLSTNIATRVFRKNFNLTTYTTLQVESMPIKTTGSAVTGGWVLPSNGYVAQNITVAQPGAYLFGVVARGAPLGGIWPHLVLRIDGAFGDAISVSSSGWQTFTLAATLTAGKHELALVFDNDAYAPPEDRNVCLDQVRYGLDPAPNVPEFLTKPGAVVQATRGRGTVVFDEIAWENAGLNSARAGRYLCSSLTDLGALQRLPGALHLEAESMAPVGVAAGATNNGIVWLYSSGRLQSSVRFTDTGTYYFDLAGYGTPAQGVYPRAELRIDGVARGSVELAAAQPQTFSLSTAVSAGVHTVAVAFINDLYVPPEDRNLALDYLEIRPPARPEILDLRVLPTSGGVQLVWLAQLGRTYDVQYSPSMESPWQTIATLTADATAVSWIDDGSVVGQPPASAQRPASFYRILLQVP